MSESIKTNDRVESAIGIPMRAFTEAHVADCMQRIAALQNAGEFGAKSASVFKEEVDPDTLAKTILNSTSRFFRNAYLFEYLNHEILPTLIDDKKEIRVWSAGCARGEEAFTLGILFNELELTKEHRIEWRIFATDADQSNIASPHLHRYLPDAVIEVKAGLLEKYFLKSEDGYTIDDAQLPGIMFDTHDLTLTDTPFPPGSIFGDFDLILCRNVLIYYGSEYQQRIVNNLCRALGPTGYLVLGAAEFLPTPFHDKMATVHERLKIFQKRWGC